MFKFKQNLLIKEAAREQEFHALRMKTKEELYDLKVKQQKLQNEKLQLEIQILQI